MNAFRHSSTRSIARSVGSGKWLRLLIGFMTFITLSIPSFAQSASDATGASAPQPATAARLKQDAVPGMTIPVWFDVDTPGTYELVCAELCGWGHYKMRGLLTVHETQAEFNEWMTSALAEQNQTQPAGATAPDAQASDPATTATDPASSTVERS